MAVLENMLHSEPSRAVNSINNGNATEERIGLWQDEDVGRYRVPKYKRRAVSAVRDFPQGCGRSVTGVSVVPATAIDPSEDSLVHSATVDGFRSIQESSLPLSDAMFATENMGTRLDELVDSTAFLDDSTNMPEDQIPVVIQGILDSIRQDETEKDFRDESSDFLDLPKVDGAASLSKGIEDQKLKDWESCANNFSPLAHSSLPIRAYPPPRRVSAIRDFPHLCGRNAAAGISESNCVVQRESLSMDTSLSGVKLLQESVPGYENDQESQRNADHLVKCKTEVSSMEDFHGRVVEIIAENENTYMPVSPALALTCVAPDDSDLSLVPSSSFHNDETTLKRTASVLITRKGKKHKSFGLRRQKGASKKRLTVDRITEAGFLDEEVAGQSVPEKDDSDSETDEKIDDLIGSFRPRSFSVNMFPVVCPNSTTNDDDNQCVTRSKVRKTLCLFQVVCRKLLREEESKSKEEAKYKRVDLQALKILKDKKKFVNTGKHILGNVPGVEVGDEFQYRVELNVIGLHRNIQAGIDYLNHGGKILATSIVSSGAYADDVDSSDFLIYTGQGGNVVGKIKVPEDQKLERGNLALKNSIVARNPVRVIRGFKETKADTVDGRSRIVVTYIYDGLYTVDKYWQEQGLHGKLVFKFHLNRIPGQPELAWKVVKKSKKFEREGVCVLDISQGKEANPIPAVNTIDNEKPPTFSYMTRVIYPESCRSLPPKGCDCVRKCSDSTKCACAVRNGGAIPFNHNGAIVEAKALVYECGPHCKCPPTCHNRVSQHGIKFPLEIFKTESRGWGVRSLASIPSGCFICEYVGELLEDKEADKMTGNDEYLFDIGNNYNDTGLWGELKAIMPDSEAGSSEVAGDDGFTIDAARCGNIGRFINHSCSPNIYAQNVLYDHEDKRIPHIMFFAMENIPPLQELTYHYNYKIDGVRDADGNIRMKSCYCGTSECTGRMY
ncbi:hypothetical protein MLD38_020856 [Melastoma candidum]|uniref:Uncharacterized protein n=1 Tax=Melastoma candidum TaxID=119954 RepID=A0ACB9QDS3_9MYRT|nr:hypothetical protein MLD38_020856 [Melastoma candidum]